MHTTTMSLKELFAWVGAEKDPQRREQKRYFLDARTFMGVNGKEEDKLLRLMVWTGTRLRSQAQHSKVHAPLDILKDGTAWCDQHCKVFAFFAFHLLGLRSQQLSLRHTDGRNRHSVCEVFYEGGWHLFDVHSDHSAVYRDPGDNHILSWVECSKQTERVEAEQHWWKGENGVGKVGFYSPTSPPVVFDITQAMSLPWGT